MSNWGLDARPKWLKITEDRQFSVLGSTPYKMPKWFCDHWIGYKLETYKYYWRFFECPDVIYQGRVVPGKEMASILGVKYHTFSNQVYHGAIRYLDFKWDIDMDGYHLKCETWENERAKRDEREAHEAEVRRLETLERARIRKESRPKLTRADYTRNWKENKIAKLKNLLTWVIRKEEIRRGCGRIYIDGVQATRRDVAKLYHLPDDIIQHLCKIGDWEYLGHKVDVRNLVKIQKTPKEKMPKKSPGRPKTFTPEEIKAKRKAYELERYTRLAKPKKEKIVKPQKPKKEKPVFEIIPYDVKPNPKKSALHVNCVKMNYAQASELTGLVRNFFKDNAGKGIIIYKDFRIEIKEIQKNFKPLRPPVISKSGPKWSINLCYMGKRYVWYHGFSREKAEEILQDILKDDKWKEKTGGVN